MRKRIAGVSALIMAMLLGACGGGSSPEPGFDQLARGDFNRRAAELFLPLFWRTDANGNGAIDPAELVTLWGVAGGGRRADYVDAAGRFTAEFRDAYRRMATAPDWSGLPPAEQARRRTVLAELAQGRPTLVETDLTGLSAQERQLVDHVLAAADTIERIYARQMGVAGIAQRVPADDPASRMLVYRNQGPFCEQPLTEHDPDCGALAPMPLKISGLYPAALQNGEDTGFCRVLEQRTDAQLILGHFSVVVARAGGEDTGSAATAPLEAEPYNLAYQADMEQVAAHLDAAAAALEDPAEASLRHYLSAAAGSFRSNDWQPADEAWSRMNATNSKWYLRIGPDEVYEDPCSRKALFHVSFARINPDGLEWQRRLKPLRGRMEKVLAGQAGPPYQAREVSFQLPDFIDIVLNAGNSRNPTGATIGQSLPNWGPVANEGRGRTVAMVNLYTDPDSEAVWGETASAVFCPATRAKMTFDPKAGVMSTVLHEAAHNLGPSHEYRVGGKTAAEIFGGPLATTLEELKAQTSALFLADWLAGEGVVDRALADRAHLRDVGWSFGHIAQGMYDAEGKPKTYSQVGAIQMGSFLRAGVIAWRAGQMAANGVDQGCFEVDLGQFGRAAAELEARVLGIKARGNLDGAEALRQEFVDAQDDWAQARKVIAERYLRSPKASFVYAVRR